MFVLACMSCAQEVVIDCGTNLTNTFDNIEDDKDVVVLLAVLFVSNDGTSLSFQVRLYQVIIMILIWSIN